MAADELWPAQRLFEGLRDFRSLARERALSELKRALGQARLPADEAEPLVFQALSADSWEARQGGLLAAAELLKAFGRSDFRQGVLAQVPHLLVDQEYRVRKAVADVLRECCLRDGLVVYDALSEVVLGDIRDKFRRSEPDGELPEVHHAPPKFLPDTEGWRSLETSMGALEAMMQGCGEAFTPRINEEMLGLLAECSRHTNRFVREYAHFALKNVFDVCDAPAFLASVGPQTVGLLAIGVRDNWSQVRFAASTAARAFMAKAGDQKARFFPQLLGPMCLNRHYVAEGVRLYSQESWRLLCGPQGGAGLLMAHFDRVIDAYAEAAVAPNHAVREAACHCIAELAGRVAGSPEAPTPHRCHFRHDRVRRLLETLVNAFQDESWPVRDVASTALGHFVRAFPLDCLEYRARLVELWFEQMADNIPCMRQNGAAAFAMAVGIWTDSLWDRVTTRLAKTLPEVRLQPEQSKIFTEYTPSGPFSVPRPKPMSLEEKSDPAVTDQTMYSCGSVAPKTFKRRGLGGGCMNCTEQKPQQPWEASEGMVHLLAELAGLAARQGSASRLDTLAALLPALAEAFGCSHYRHHHLYKQRVCERLPGLSAALGRRLLPQLPPLLRLAQDCAAQDAHRALHEVAEAALAAWRQQFSPEELEAGAEPRSNATA